MFNLTTHKQSDHLIAILSFQGNLDHLTYRELINQANELYTNGYRNLVLDMRGIPNLGLSGTFALYSAATVFSGDIPLDPAGGLKALRAMADKVVSKPTPHFKLLRPQPAVKNALSQSGLSVYDDMESVLTSIAC
ncbi:MAG: hypothetical protein IPM53_31130 [Anaerolineaceae bacterium]|nr:hypothetical protein [Anaerolineaceae bacterium]